MQNREEETDLLCMAYLLLKRRKQSNKTSRRYWVRSLNTRRITDGQFCLMYGDLRESPEKFFKYYKMSVKTFDELLDNLRCDIMKENTHLRLSISPEERLTVTLRYLSTGLNFSALGVDFLMGNSTIGYIIRQVCAVIWKKLKPIEMAVPTTHDWLSISAGLFKSSDFPNCVGAIDGKHIRLKSAVYGRSSNYVNNGLSTVSIMAVCDANYCFRMIDVGSYKEEDDIFKGSTFGQRVLNGGINFPPDGYLPGDETGKKQPFYLIGDEAFPLRTNLLRPFPGKSLDKERKIFNSRLTRARRNAESAFAILANKWQVFHRPILVSTEFAIDIVKACCVLHNFVCRRDEVNYEETLTCPLQNFSPATAKNYTNDAKCVREYVMNYVNTKNVLSWLS